MLDFLSDPRDATNLEDDYLKYFFLGDFIKSQMLKYGLESLLPNSGIKEFLSISKRYPDISPHPLFNRVYMRDCFGNDWVNHYIFFQKESDPVAPNEITSFGFLASQIYTNVPIWQAPFVYKETSGCVDFNINLYSQLCSLHNVIPAHGFFADYCLRSNYKIIPHASYASLFNS